MCRDGPFSRPTLAQPRSSKSTSVSQAAISSSWTWRPLKRGEASRRASSSPSTAAGSSLWTATRLLISIKSRETMERWTTTCNRVRRTKNRRLAMSRPCMSVSPSLKTLSTRRNRSSSSRIRGLPILLTPWKPDRGACRRGLSTRLAFKRSPTSMISILETLAGA